MFVLALKEANSSIKVSKSTLLFMFSNERMAVSDNFFSPSDDLKKFLINGGKIIINSVLV